MRTYPDVITSAELEGAADVSDAVIAADIDDTQREIDNYRALQIAEREIARVHPSQAERRMADFKAGARDGQIAEREAFIAYLRRLQAARAGAV